jgi:deoxyribodipyrimidine photo-lyase
VDAALQRRGSRLVLRHGRPEEELPALAREVGAREVHFSADVSPFAQARDRRVSRALRAAGCSPEAHPGTFVVDDLATIRTSGGGPYSVFTPFYRAWLRQPRREVLGAPDVLPGLPGVLDRGQMPRPADLGLTQQVAEASPGGERAARAAAEAYLAGEIGRYHQERNLLGRPAVSRLSPYLHFGCISPRKLEAELGSGAGPEAFRRQLCWRDFYAHVLLAYPDNARLEFQAAYRGELEWSQDIDAFEAWTTGRTGYPLVDAGMRQLQREGWMHNRARLVVGSFLTKDLGIDWRRGEQWFMRWLLDGDQASNNGNWQWIASVGVDPQPAFRSIYNPARQQQRFDPDGRYVRRYVPELRLVPDAYLAEPWTMPDAVQQEANCRIGQDYPHPIVEHKGARHRALERYGAVRR